jgi:hypothetical protein
MTIAPMRITRRYNERDATEFQHLALKIQALRGDPLVLLKMSPLGIENLREQLFGSIVLFITVLK